MSRVFPSSTHSDEIFEIAHKQNYHHLSFSFFFQNSEKQSHYKMNCLPPRSRLRHRPASHRTCISTPVAPATPLIHAHWPSFVIISWARPLKKRPLKRPWRTIVCRMTLA